MLAGFASQRVVSFEDLNINICLEICFATNETQEQHSLLDTIFYDILDFHENTCI